MTTTPSDEEISREPWEPADEWFGKRIKAQWTEREFFRQGYRDGLAAGRAERQRAFDHLVRMREEENAAYLVREQKLAALVEGLREAIADLSRDDRFDGGCGARDAEKLRALLQSAAPTTTPRIDAEKESP